MKINTLILTASLGLAAVAGAQAAVIFDNYGSPPPGFGGAAWTTKPSQWIGRGFTPSQSATLSQVSLALFWQYGDREGINVSLRTDNGGKPSSTILESWVGTTTADGYFSVPFPSVSHQQLDAGTPYWVVATSDVPTDDRGWGQVAPSTTAWIAASLNQGASWHTLTLPDVALQVEGDAVGVPEPSQWAMMAVTALGIAGYAARRVRAKTNVG